MCGINGFNFKNDELIVKMSSCTKSRGPDFTDYFKSKITQYHIIGLQ